MCDNAYEIGDKIEWWSRLAQKWVLLGTYLATSSNGSIVCENSEGSASVYDNVDVRNTRRAPDTITVTVEIDRAGAEAIAGTEMGLMTSPARVEAVQAFIDAVREAVES